MATQMELRSMTRIGSGRRPPYTPPQAAPTPKTEEEIKREYEIMVESEREKQKQQQLSQLSQEEQQIISKIEAIRIKGGDMDDLDKERLREYGYDLYGVRKAKETVSSQGAIENPSGYAGMIVSERLREYRAEQKIKQQEATAKKSGFTLTGEVVEYKGETPVRVESFRKGVSYGVSPVVIRRPMESMTVIDIPPDKTPGRITPQEVEIPLDIRTDVSRNIPQTKTRIWQPTAPDLSKELQWVSGGAGTGVWFNLSEPTQVSMFGKQQPQKVSAIYEPSIIKKQPSFSEQYIEPRTEKVFGFIQSKIGPGKIPVPTREGIASLGLPALYIGEKVSWTKRGKEYFRGGKEELANVLYGKQLIKRSNIAEASLKTTEAVEFIGDVSAEGYRDIFTTTGFGKKIAASEKWSSIATIIPAAAKLTPTIAAYSFAPSIYAGVNILSGSEKLKQLDITTEKETQRQYLEMVRTSPPEGYEWQTYSEFKSTAFPEIKAGMRKQILGEGAINIGILGATAVFKGYQLATKPTWVGDRSVIIKGSTMKGMGTISAPKGTLYRTFEYRGAVERGITSPARRLFGFEPKWTQITKPQIYISKGIIKAGSKVSYPVTGKISKVPSKLTPQELEQLGLYGKLTPKIEVYKLKGKKIFELKSPETIQENILSGGVIKTTKIYPKKLVLDKVGITGNIESSKAIRLEPFNTKPLVPVDRVNIDKIKLYLKTAKNIPEKYKVAEGLKLVSIDKGISRYRGKIVYESIPSGVRRRIPEKLLRIESVEKGPEFIRFKKTLSKMAGKELPAPEVRKVLEGVGGTRQGTKQLLKQIPKGELAQTEIMLPVVKAAQIPKFVPKLASGTLVNVGAGLTQVFKPQLKMKPEVQYVQITKQQTDLTKQPLFQEPVLDEATETTQGTAEILKLATTQKQVTSLVEVQKVGTVPRLRQQLTFRTPTPTPKLIPLILPTEDNLLTRKLKKLQAEGKSVDIIVGMERKKTRTLAKNLPPFAALKKASEYVDDNIEASFRLKVNPRKPKERDISKYEVNQKFRPSKRDALYVVEKKKYRLDRPQERVQIKRPKLKKMKFF